MGLFDLSKQFLKILMALMLLCALSACGSEETEVPSESSPDTTEPVAEKPAESYDDIAALFADVCPGSEIVVSQQSSRIHARIITDIPSDVKPDGWEDTLSRFESALSESNDCASSHGASAVSAQIESCDEVILSSGFDGSVKFDLFNEKSQDKKENPPTISKFEYDQISVGMTLSQVREIIGGDGTLQSEIGTAGSPVGMISTYRWIGEGREGAYADILFNNYQVYSKQQLWLE